MPQVQVTQDPLAVLLIVGLIAAAVILGVVFTILVRVPRVPRATASSQGPVSSPTLVPPQTGALPPADARTGEPWSTGTNPTSPPWSTTDRGADKHD